MLFIPGIDLDLARGKSVYIYGAGSTADLAYEKLVNNGVNVLGFVDSFKGGYELKGKPVSNLSDYLNIHSLDHLIVIASEFQHTIGSSLRRHGISNFVSGFHFAREKSPDLLNAQETKLRERLWEVIGLVPQEFLSEVKPAPAVDQVIGWARMHGYLSKSPGYSTISMVSPEVQAISQLLALFCRGGILEIGAYVGGLTIPTALAARQSGRRFVTVEPGGAHPDHPILGTDDIAKDLMDHIEYFGIADAVNPIIGTVDNPSVRQEIGTLLGEEGVGLYIDDSDGNVDSHFGNFQDLRRPGTFIIVDDFIDSYTSPAINKSRSTRNSIYKKVVNGELEEIGVFGHGTWVGYQKI